MTREEAIEVLENGDWWDRADIPCDTDAAIKFHTALEVAISALQAQQTPLNRSRWKGCKHCDDLPPCYTCKHKKSSPDSSPCDDCLESSEAIAPYWEGGIAFCSECGRPLTEEAWAQLERRISGG